MRPRGCHYAWPKGRKAGEKARRRGGFIASGVIIQSALILVHTLDEHPTLDERRRPRRTALNSEEQSCKPWPCRPRSQASWSRHFRRVGCAGRPQIAGEPSERWPRWPRIPLWTRPSPTGPVSSPLAAPPHDGTDPPCPLGSEPLALRCDPSANEAVASAPLAALGARASPRAPAPRCGAAGDNLLSRVVNAAISFPPLFAVMKAGARTVMKSTAEQRGIGWSSTVAELEQSEASRPPACQG